MYKYYIIFSKNGYIKFTSHLDMVRLFQRSFKRASIKLAYSQGFNPHPKLSFAQPLSLGYTSENEYLEFETIEEQTTTNLLSILNAVMPQGIEILDCQKYEDKKSLAAKVVAAEYEIRIPANITEVDIDTFMGQEQILVTKYQKKSKKETIIDVKPMIESLWEREGVIHTTVKTGSTTNLNPELLIKTLASFLDKEIDPSKIKIHRKKLIFEGTVSSV